MPKCDFNKVAKPFNKVAKPFRSERFNEFQKLLKSTEKKLLSYLLIILRPFELEKNIFN